MTKEQKEVIDRIKYNDIAMPLYCGDMTICNIDDLKTILSMLEEQENKIKQLGKGQHTLMQSRRKWKHRYYKMKDKNKDLQKSVEQIYDDYQDIGKMAFNYSDKIEEQDKIIDLMAEMLNNHDIDEDICRQMGQKENCNEFTNKENCKTCIKQYFENKVKEVE